MAHFFGRLSGNRGEATRLGSKDSGIRATAETWTSILIVAQDHNASSDADVGFFAIQDKNGSTIFHTEFNADDIVRASRDGSNDVRRALNKLGDAFAEVSKEAREWTKGAA